MSTLTIRLDAYDADAQTAVRAAQSLADARKHAEVDPLHLLYVLVERDDRAQEAVRKAGVDPIDVLVEAELHLRRRAGRGATGEAFLSARTLELLSRAERDAARGGRTVSVSDLLVACANEDVGAMREVFRATGLTPVVVRAAAASAFAGTPARGVTASARIEQRERIRRSDDGSRERDGGRVSRSVDERCRERDVEREADDERSAATRHGPRRVRGRPRERGRCRIDSIRWSGATPSCGASSRCSRGATRTIRCSSASRASARPRSCTRSRRASRAHDVPRHAPRASASSRSTLGALLAGAKLRGELEERMRALLGAVRDASGEVILFVPDLGALTGASAAAPAICSRPPSGAASCASIAVATPDAVRKSLDEHDPLSRRFVPIDVEPPTVDETIAILRGVVERFEQAHGVRIADPALVAAVQLARRYVPGVYAPQEPRSI